MAVNQGARVQIIEFTATNTLYAVLATGAAVAAVAFGIGRSILLARITSAETRRGQAEESAGLWRRKAETVEREAQEASSEAQKQLRERTDALARIEDQLSRARRDAQFNEEVSKKKVAELEGLVRDKDLFIAEQDREFRERIAKMTREMKAVVTKLTNEAA